MSVLSDFNDLINQTSNSLTEIDDYDLDGDNPESVEDFKYLEEMHLQDLRVLIKFVVEWHLELLEALN